MMRNKGDSFVFIDELAYFRDVYSPYFEPKEVFYELDEPFLTDSQFEAQKKEGNRRIRRKRKLEMHAPQFLVKNTAHVRENYEKFLHSINVSSTSNDDTQNLIGKDNNRRAREAVKNTPSTSQMKYSDSASLESIDISSTSNAIELFTPMLVKNGSQSVASVRNSADDREFVVPPNCEFINGDVRMLRHIVHRNTTFDLIVIDPPWSNKAVKRQKSYATFDDLNDLASLPINELLNADGLVCIWLSNSKHVHSKARDILSSHWSLTELAVWHWLKVCRSNYQPVVEFRPEHKVPFESLLIACKHGNADKFETLAEMQNFTIICVPNCNPSRKPPVAPILRQLAMHKPSSTLEIFARYLLPNTLSVGNEVVKFQDFYFFDVLTM